MIEENVGLELKVESAVVLGSIAKGTEDNIRSLIDAGAISVLFKGHYAKMYYKECNLLVPS